MTNDLRLQPPLVIQSAANNPLDCSIGHGVYWVIVEILHEESKRRLELSNLTYVAIARQASTSVEQVRSIVECCLEYGLFFEEDGCFFSNRVLGNIDKRMDISKKRAKAGRILAKKRQKATNAEHVLTSVEQNPTKKRKEKEIKEKNIVDTTVSMSDAEHPTQEKIDYKTVINFFNEETQGVFGKVMHPISNQRRECIRVRINEFSKDAFADMVRKASKSSFLKGDSNKGFVAKFDWMISSLKKLFTGANLDGLSSPLYPTIPSTWQAWAQVFSTKKQGCTTNIYGTQICTGMVMNGGVNVMF